jgi:Zn-dependent protease
MRRIANVIGLRVPVTIGWSGLAPAVLLAAIFAGFATQTNVPIGMAALLGAIGGTASLLIHELGHVRVARRLTGIKTARISLLWMGAATRFEGRYESGRDQARVAIAGPSASFVVALSLGALCFLPMPVPLKEAVLLLALFNIGLGVINLVPAYPLDGHKLVVGLMWSLTGSEKKARSILRRAGMACAALELPSALFLLVEKPQLGVAIAFTAASFIAQKRLTRQSAPQS